MSYNTNADKYMTLVLNVILCLVVVLLMFPVVFFVRFCFVVYDLIDDTVTDAFSFVSDVFNHSKL